LIFEMSKRKFVNRLRMGV